MKEIYILTNLDGLHRGVYHSLDQLSDGVNVWIAKEPNETLIYEEWYHPGSKEITWKYAYVSQHDYHKAYHLSSDHRINEQFPWDSLDQNLVPSVLRKRMNKLFDKLSALIAVIAKAVATNPVFFVLVVALLYGLAIELEWVNNPYENAAATPAYIFAVTVTLVGILLDHYGYKLINKEENHDDVSGSI